MPASARESALTVVELLIRYEDETMPAASPTTKQARLSAVVRFARWMEPRQLVEATTVDVTTWVSSEIGQTKRGRTTANLHRFYNWLQHEGLVEHDPTLRLVHIRQPLEVGELPGVLRGWEASMQRRALSPTTVRSFVRRVKYFADFLAPKAIFDATAKDVEQFLGVGILRRTHLSSDATRGYLTALHRFYLWAHKEGLTDTDPTEAVDRPRLSERVPRPISDPDLTAAMEQAEPTVRAVLALAAYCGLRAKEIAGVHREDILDHLEAPALIVSSPKGRRQRTVPLHRVAWEALQAMGLPRSGPVFRRADGRQMPPWEVSHIGCDFLASVGSISTLHALRHWYGTQVYRTSKDIRLTQELLGHSSPTQTALYVQADQSAAHAVIERIGLPT